MIFLACPPVYTLPGTWSDPEKIAKCNDTLIPHFTFNPDYTFGISIAVITVLLAAYGIYKGFFANKNLTDPWDDHDRGERVDLGHHEPRLFQRSYGLVFGAFLRGRSAGGGS